LRKRGLYNKIPGKYLKRGVVNEQFCQPGSKNAVRKSVCGEIDNRGRIRAASQGDDTLEALNQQL
jgi:hypothetical protein